MLLKDDVDRMALLDKIAAVAPVSPVTREVGELIERIQGSANDPSFPGAVLIASPNGHLVFYAIAETGAEWRELAPLLLASVGTTTTNFTGRSSQGLDGDPIVQILHARGMFAVNRFGTYDDSNRERNALHALARLRSLLKEAPTSPRTLPRSVSKALYDFRAALAAGDHMEAEGTLTYLRNEMRIDALNRSFLEVRLDEAFGDWSRLVARESFQFLCRTRRPPAITAAMVEALYHTKISPAEQADDPPMALETFRSEVLSRSGTLFAFCPPEPRPSVGKAFLLAALAEEMPDLVLIERLDKAARSWPENEARFFHSLRELAPPSPTLASDVIGQIDYEALLAAAQNERAIPPTLERAKAVLFSAMNVQSLDAYQTALAYIARLDGTTRERLLAMPFIRPLWDNMSRYSTAGGLIPHDWREWIELLPSMTLSQAAIWAEAAVMEYPIAQQLQHPEDIDALIAALNNPPIEAQERLFEALPSLVEWVQADYLWPNQAYIGVYNQLFDLLLYSNQRTGSLYKALSTLITGMFEVGLGHDQYRAVLASLGDSLPGLSGARDLDWLCDLAEMTITYPCPDVEARASFWHQLIAVLAQYGARLMPQQYSVLTEVAQILGLVDTLEMIPSVTTIHAVSSGPIPNHRTIGIYTLTEGVGERVARILGDEYMGIKVQVNHDAVSTPRLRDLARKADIFVICWLSAKHAATDSINQERPSDRKTIYAPGKGSSSICHEIRRYLDTQVATN